MSELQVNVDQGAGEMPVVLDTHGVGLTHVDGQGRARIVDITAKQPSQRRAVASCDVHSGAGSFGVLADEEVRRIIETARMAGTVAGKETSRLIPLCHPILIDTMIVDCRWTGTVFEVDATVQSYERTGLEMEALTACAFAALVVVGELGMAGHDPVVEDLAVLEKSGGRSGDWHRQAMSVRSSSTRVGPQRSPGT